MDDHETGAAMKFLIMIGALLFFVTPVTAQSYKLVGYQCDAKERAVIITYIGGLTKAGQGTMKKKEPNQWDPWSLVVLTKDGNSIDSTKPVHGQCKWEDGIYGITLGPLPGNGNLQGMCGGHMGAWAEVKRDSELVLPRYPLESGDCFNTEPVTAKIVIRVGSNKPVITKVSHEDFYRLR
jgi:hypothetical protein